MKMPKLMAAAMLAFALAGCSKGVAGKYACDGIPGVKELELAADGSYGSKGTVMSDEMSASGTYKVDKAHVSLSGTTIVPSLSRYYHDGMVFDRQSNGDLKWVLATCKRT